MADNADLATEIIERSLAGSLAMRPVTHAVATNTDCEDCGWDIPAERRQAAPWATTCIDCQDIRERRARHAR